MVAVSSKYITSHATTRSNGAPCVRTSTPDPQACSTTVTVSDRPLTCTFFLRGDPRWGMPVDRRKRVQQSGSTGEGSGAQVLTAYSSHVPEQSEVVAQVGSDHRCRSQGGHDDRHDATPGRQVQAPPLRDLGRMCLEEFAGVQEVLRALQSPQLGVAPCQGR